MILWDRLKVFNAELTSNLSNKIICKPLQSRETIPFMQQFLRVQNCLRTRAHSAPFILLFTCIAHYSMPAVPVHFLPSPVSGFLSLPCCCCIPASGKLCVVSHHLIFKSYCKRYFVYVFCEFKITTTHQSTKPSKPSSQSPEFIIIIVPMCTYSHIRVFYSVLVHTSIVQCTPPPPVFLRRLYEFNY